MNKRRVAFRLPLLAGLYCLLAAGPAHAQIWSAAPYAASDVPPGREAAERFRSAAGGQVDGSPVPMLRRGGAAPLPQDASGLAVRQRPDQVQQERLAAERPLPPNDFQKFVLESTGHALPLFGASFFAGNGGFGQTPTAPVSSDYVLGPGDEVLVRGWGSLDVDVRAVVDRSGQIYLPRVGAVSLSGVRYSQVEAVLRTAVGRYYKDFQLSVTMGQLRGMTIYVVGQAKRPGAYNLSGTSTLVSALFASGGPNPTGSLRQVRVKRGEKVVAELDLYAFLARGDKSGDIRLQDGDTLVIPPARGHVALLGKVNVPAVYELAAHDTIESILALSGGLPVVADPKTAYLERVDPASKPARSVDRFALDARALKTPLRNGDLLTVLPLTAEFGNAVTLRGNVDQPVRLPWREGMKVRDLIPSKAVLMSRASVQRQNEVLLSPLERRRAARAFAATEGRPPSAGRDDRRPSRDGLPQDDDPDLSPGDIQRRETRLNADSLAESVGNLVDEVNMEYAVIERVDSKDVSVQLLPFNLGRALSDANSPDNLPLQPGDILTVFSVSDVRVPQAKRQVFVRVEGEVLRPGVYQMKPGEGLQQLVARAGGLTPDAYLFGAEFYREEVRQAQTVNLDRTVRRLESELQSRLSTSAASVSTGQDNATAAQLRLSAETAAQKQSLERLRNLRPSGRIMLGLPPDAATANALPELRLEGMDRLVIPSRPDFVYVLGSVNTEASLIWRQGRTVQDYLNLAGVTSGADVDQLFVIRADGSVASNASQGWFGGVTRTEVMPGDTIVLPEKTDHETAWSAFTRNAKDITQIVYQFSLGAAAIKTLRD